MITKISAYFQRIGVEHELDTASQALSFDVNSPQGLWHCSVLVDISVQSQGGLAFYSTLPSKVQPALRNQVAMFLMCLNNDRLFGNFELDPKTGAVHFKTYIDFENSSFSEKAIERNMLINISIMQKHIPQILEIMNFMPSTQS